jgi:hypothetical protein
MWGENVTLGLRRWRIRNKGSLSIFYGWFIGWDSS